MQRKAKCKEKQNAKKSEMQRKAKCKEKQSVKHKKAKLKESKMQRNTKCKTKKMFCFCYCKIVSTGRRWLSFSNPNTKIDCNIFIIKWLYSYQLIISQYSSPRMAKFVEEVDKHQLQNCRDCDQERQEPHQKSCYLMCLVFNWESPDSSLKQWVSCTDGWPCKIKIHKL